MQTTPEVLEIVPGDRTRDLSVQPFVREVSSLTGVEIFAAIIYPGPLNHRPYPVFALSIADGIDGSGAEQRHSEHMTGQKVDEYHNAGSTHRLWALKGNNNE